MATKKTAAPKKKTFAKKTFGKKTFAKKTFAKKSPADRKTPSSSRSPARATAAKKKPFGGKKSLQPKRPPRPRKPPQPGAPRSPRSAVAIVSAGPMDGATAAPARAGKPDPARPTALAIAQAGLDKKAEDVTVLDVRGLTSYADYFVVMTADSDRQAGAIAEHVEQTMKSQGVSKVGVEGYEGGRWILVDYGDVVAHVMNRESRGFYDIEGLWADAPRFRVQE
jgi:ribosome-associated protein